MNTFKPLAGPAPGAGYFNGVLKKEKKWVFMNISQPLAGAGKLPVIQ